MWNQAANAGIAGAGGASGQPGSSSSAYSNMAHTPGPFAQHARPTSVMNSPSAHRRAGGVGPAQHASPSNSSAFPRPFTNTAFPGVVSGARSTAPSNSASAPQRSIQHLPLLTAHTPVSLLKLAFPPQTTILWHRLQRKEPTTAAETSHDAPIAVVSAQTGSSEETCKAWERGVQAVLASVARAQADEPNNADNAQAAEDNRVKVLLRDPLVYTSSTRSSQRLSHAHPRRSAAELWLLVTTTQTIEVGSESSVFNTAGQTAAGSTQPTSGEPAFIEAASKDTKLQGHEDSASSLSIDPRVAHQLLPDLVKALSRLSESAIVTSGSYALASAAPTSLNAKGKQSSLTSEQSQAHKRFMASIKARILDSILRSYPKPQTNDTTHTFARSGLRLGDNFVLSPAHVGVSNASNSAETAWSNALGQAMTSADGMDRHMLITKLDISLQPTSLLVRAVSSRIAAVPLAGTRHVQPHASMLPTATASTVILSPLGTQAELVNVVPASSIAGEHLSELCSLFSLLNAGTAGSQPGEDAVFAQGFALCTLPAASTDAGTSQGQTLGQEYKAQDMTLDSFAQGEIGDEAMDMSALSTIQQHEQPQAHHDKPERRQFLWPVTWCILLQDRVGATIRLPGSGGFAQNDLQTMRSQPMTPLKELVSFTLKVLNDANETTFSHNTAPYTPGEADDASLSRHRVDRLSSTRPDITPASMSFPDFDFAVPGVGSATPSQSHAAAARSVPSTSPAKREATGTELAQASHSTEGFGDDLNWMQFLPQASEAAAPASAPAAAPESAMQVQSRAVPASELAPAPSVHAVASDRDVAMNTTSDWTFPTGTASAPPGTEAIAQPSHPSAPQSLLPPQGQMHSQGSTPFQAQDVTPLGLSQPAQTKRKAGETDIFGNLGLLTEDDFSFFDESAFGLEPESAMSGPPVPLLDRPVSASSSNVGFGQRPAMLSHPPHSTAAVSQPAPAHSGTNDDVAMEDIEQNSLDALFSAIPGLQDVMTTAEPLQHPSGTAPPSIATSVAALAQANQARVGASEAHETSSIPVSSAHPFHPSLSSFTPRDASGATPFGDPASLPGFTPSSLTESSPAFGNPNHKTPRTPYSPVEEYRDGATIVDLQNTNRRGDPAQSYREHDSAPAPDASGPPSLPDHKKTPFLKEESLHLADASTAAAAAANAAMEHDNGARKRPAIVPNAFLPISQPEARKPLQRLTAGARANLGRKYDLLGKFASKPKTASTGTTGSIGAVHASSTDQHALKDARAGRADRASAPEPGRPRQAPMASHFGLGGTRLSPSKTPSRRGQALLQLPRDRNNKASPGSTLINTRRTSSQRTIDVPATPRSSDDIALSGAISASDSDSSSSGEEDSDDATSDAEGAVLMLSPEDQATFKSLSRELVTSYLCGTSQDASVSSQITEQGLDVAISCKRLALLPSRLHRPTIRRWMLKRTAEWLVQNPQFRAIYGVRSPSKLWSDATTGEKMQVLEAMASTFSIAPPAKQQETEDASAPLQPLPLPTLQSLVKPLKPSAVTNTEEVGIAEVLEPSKIAVGCQGSVVETLPSALTLWDKSKLSAVSGQKHVVAKVLLTHASPAWLDEIVAWLERLRTTFESHGLGTHTGGVQSILAVADGSESMALSSYLDRLWKDGEAWIDTLRSISSRVQLDLSQGKHVVVYTLQPPDSPACSSTGFVGLMRLEADLRAMLSEQVGVLSEQLLVRPVNPALVTEGGSLGFSQQTQSLRRLTFSVYDQLPRLVRRQPAKVLHGREPGPISAVVQFPAFSLSTKSDASPSGSTSSTNPSGRTHFSLNWPEEPAAALDEHVLLHVSYRICETKPLEHAQASQEMGQADGRSVSFDGTNIFGLGSFVDSGLSSSIKPEKLVLVSAIDERGGSSSVDAIASTHGDSSIEACVERVWRFALAEASRARVRWRLAISSAGMVSQREYRSWQRLIGMYMSATDAKERVMGSVALLSVRTDESGVIIAEKGAQMKPSQDWTTTTTSAADRSSLVLLDAGDFSQMLQFAVPMPMDWTLPYCTSNLDEEGEGEKEAMVMIPSSSAILVHKPRRDLLGSSHHEFADARTTNHSHVLAVDLVECWTPTPTPTPKADLKSNEKHEQEEQEAMDAILRSLHRLRLISEERHQLPYPYNAQPWSIAAVNTLANYLSEVVLAD